MERFGGIARRIERRYRRYRQRGEANSGMEAWLDNVMVEHTCPDCNGARVRATRLLFTIAGKTIHEFGQLNFDELHAFLGAVDTDAGWQSLPTVPAAYPLVWGSGTQTTYAFVGDSQLQGNGAVYRLP